MDRVPVNINTLGPMAYQHDRDRCYPATCPEMIGPCNERGSHECVIFYFFQKRTASVHVHVGQSSAQAQSYDWQISCPRWSLRLRPRLARRHCIDN
jgi:hypothetical protein